MKLTKVRISLTNKLFLFFFLIGFSSVFLISTYSHINTKKALMQRTFNQLTSVRVIKKRQLEIFFRDRIQDVKNIPSSANIRSLMGQVTDTALGNELSMLKKSHYFSGMYISDFENGLFVSLNSDSVNHINLNDNNDSIPTILYLNDIKKSILLKEEMVIKDYFAEDKYHLFIGTPFHEKHALTGMIVMEINTQTINDIMLELDNRTGLGHSGESYLVGADYYMRSSSRFHDTYIKNPVRTTAIENALKNYEGTDIIKDYRGVKVLSSFSLLKIGSLEWAIIAEIDYKEAITPILRNRNRIILMGVFITLLLLFFSYVISSHITHPIIRLSRALNLLGAGSFDNAIEYRGTDEIGELTNSFNEMSAKIKKQTNELYEREQHLRHFYNATVDGIVLHNRGTPLLVNQALCKLTAYTEEELKRIKIDGFLVCKEEKNISDTQNNFSSYEAYLVKKDQSVIEVEVQEAGIEYRGQFVKALVIRDISIRKKNEKALAEERAKRLSFIIDGAETERQRLSRELHDGLGQSLIAIKLKLESIDECNAEKSKNVLSDTKNLFDSTIDEVRRISNNLMPAVLYEFGIQTALSNLCKRMDELAEFKIDFYSNLTGDNYDKKIKTYLYRIAQEALNNCIKHANASLVKVYLLQNRNHIKLIIKDNGKGFIFDESSGKHGSGILNMRERANLLNAKLEIHSEIAKGTEIILEIVF